MLDTAQIRWWLQLRFDFDSTAIRPLFDCNSIALRPLHKNISYFPDVGASRYVTDSSGHHDNRHPYQHTLVQIIIQ